MAKFKRLNFKQIIAARQPLISPLLARTCACGPFRALDSIALADVVCAGRPGLRPPGRHSGLQRGMLLGTVRDRRHMSHRRAVRSTPQSLVRGIVTLVDLCVVGIQTAARACRARRLCVRKAGAQRLVRKGAECACGARMVTRTRGLDHSDRHRGAIPRGSIALSPRPLRRRSGQRSAHRPVVAFARGLLAVGGC